MEHQNSSNRKRKPDAAFSPPAVVADRDGDAATTTTNGATPEFMPSPDRRMSTNHYKGCSYCGGNRNGNGNGNGWSDHDYLNSFPPGFRFCPTDKELILHYLMKKIRREPLPPNIIREVNIYNYNPAQLIERFRRNGENEWYFFTTRDKKYPGGSRPNRAAGDGYWKVTGQYKQVEENKRVVGSKKALVFYFGKPPDGTKTNWIMHEFMVGDDKTSHKKTKTKVVCQPRTDMRLDDCVLCKIYEKIPKGGGDGGSNGGNGSDGGSNSGNGSDGGSNGGNGSDGGSNDDNGSDSGNNGVQGNDNNAMNPIENHEPEDDPLLSSDVGRFFHEPQPCMNGLEPDLAPVQLPTQTSGLNPVFSGHDGGFGLGPVLGILNGRVGLGPMLPAHIGFGAPHGSGLPHITKDPFYNSGKHAFVQAPTYRAQPISFWAPLPENVYRKCHSSDPDILNVSKQETPGYNEEEGDNGLENYDPHLESYLNIEENDLLDCHGTGGLE